MRKIGGLVIFLIIFVVMLRWINEDKRYYCGLLNDKPKLYMGLEPTWFDSTLQFNITYKPYLIAGTWIDDFRGDPYVSGSEQFSLIMAYANYNDEGLLFKAINKQGGLSTYRYQYNIDKCNNKSSGKVEIYNKSLDEKVMWHDITFTNCKSWFIPDFLMPGRIKWRELESSKD